LNRTVAAEFYSQNSGFFLLCGTLAFGFMSGAEHKALAQFFVSGPSTLAVPVGIWLLYTLKVIRFNGAQLHLPSNRFLFTAQFLPRHQLWLICAQSFGVQLFPVFAYGLYLMTMASSLTKTCSVITIVLALLGCLCFGTFVMYKSLGNPHREFRTSVVTRFFDQRIIRPWVQVYVEWLLRMKPLKISGLKMVTCLLLFGVIALYDYENYDWRLLAMAVTFAGIANVFIVFPMVAFEHTHIGWIKNIPLTRGRRFMTLITASVFFLLPEFIVLARNFPVNLDIQWLLVNVMYLVSLMAFFLGLLHITASPIESITKRSFLILVVLLILILFKIHPIALAFVNTATGYTLFRKHYYSFE